ncbi:MAG: intracellular septation protein A [Myxococcota bacterium]|jgi:intracellular septation protein A
MQWQLLLLSVAPLAVFMLAVRRTTQTRAIAAALVVSLCELVFNWAQLHFVDPFSLTSLLLFGALGFASIRTGNIIFFKFQPVAFEVAIGAALFYYNFIVGTPLFAEILIEHVQINEIVPVYQRGYYANYVTTLSSSIPFVFLLHAGLTAYGALMRSSMWWFVVRVVGLYAMAAVVFYAERLITPSY